jgi:hypothetical protein
MPKSPFAETALDPALIRQELRAELTALLRLPNERMPLQAQVLSSSRRNNTLIEEFQFESEPGLRITGWFVTPLENRSLLPTLIYLNDRGGEDIVQEPSPMESVLSSGHAICALSLRGLGLTAPRFPREGPRFNSGGLPERFAWASLSLGQPVISQRVWDIFRGIDYVAGRADVDPSQIRILGAGGAGLATMLAAALDDRLRSVLLERTLVSYASILESEDYSLSLDWILPGVLLHFDLPDVASALGPRPLWLFNPVDARGSVLTEEALGEQYKRQLDMGSAALGNLRTFIRPGQKSTEVLTQWLKQT